LTILHRNGFQTEDRQKYKSTIYRNVLQCVKELIVGAQGLNIECGVPEIMKKLQSSSDSKAEESSDDNFDVNQDLSEETAKIISQMWNDSGIQKAYSQRSQFQLLDCAQL
jgi:guanine nucleotide-binding protein G(i) subunit alpha